MPSHTIIERKKKTNTVTKSNRTVVSSTFTKKNKRAELLKRVG